MPNKKKKNKGNTARERGNKSHGKRKKEAIATEHKERGNTFYGQKMYRKALEEYNEAIKHCPHDHKLYSNRSACYIELNQFTAALSDGKRCIKLKPDWVKGYYRTGLALFKLCRVEEASNVYKQGTMNKFVVHILSPKTQMFTP